MKIDVTVTVKADETLLSVLNMLAKSISAGTLNAAQREGKVDEIVDKVGQAVSGADTGEVDKQEKSYTFDDLAVASAKLRDDGKLNELVAILKDFGVQAITELPEDRYPDFAERLRQLGADL